MKKRLFLATCLSVSLAAASAVYDVRAFGAKGDGRAKDTVAIQKAIDAAAAAGGGTVRLGAGTFLSGSVCLRSDVALFLDHGATLKGSPDRKDYGMAGAHLLLCIGQTNVTVRGHGRIDGSCGAFMVGPDGKNWPGGPAGIPWRPGRMLHFSECDGVLVEGVSLIDSPHWSCSLHACARVKVRDVLVRTRREPVHAHDGGGMDVDGCEDVEISGCDVDTADDCIALRADAKRTKKRRHCARIRVSDCRLSSPCNAVRIEAGDGVVRDAAFGNVWIRDTRTAVDVVSVRRDGGDGAGFRNVSFDGMKVECRAFCRICPLHDRNAKFEGIRFSDVSGSTLLPGWIWGYAENPVGEVTFENVDLPNGISAVGVKSLKTSGGTLKRNEMSREESSRRESGIENATGFPGAVKIGGTVRGSAAHGGEVKMPVRGLCAHQGDMQFFPGNTAAAVASAARKGAAMIEFDVQRCKTGEFVLMHDPTIDALTTGKGRIREHSLEELKSFVIRRFREKGYRIPTLDEALDVIPDGGTLINVHCYAGRSAMGDVARHLKARGRLHQAFVCAVPKDISLAREAVPGIMSDNIQRPGPRNRDWTPEECSRFVEDSKRHRCEYLQLSRPWERKHSDAAHAAGVKVIHYRSDRPEELEDLFGRGIDFVMTNRLDPMTARFRELGLETYR